MKSYLRQLGARALGHAPVVAPAVEPLFAPARNPRLDELQPPDESTMRSGSSVAIDRAAGMRPALAQVAAPASQTTEALRTERANESEPWRELLRSMASRVPTPRDEQTPRDRAAPAEGPSAARGAQRESTADSPHESSLRPAAPETRPPIEGIIRPVVKQAASNPVQPPIVPAATAARLDRDDVLRELLSTLRPATVSRAGSAAQRESSEAQAPQIVRVTIGRVDVRLPPVATPSSAPRRRDPSTSRRLSLEDYLSRKPGVPR